MNTTEILEALRQGAGVWLRGALGSGRTHQLEKVAEVWPGAVLRLPSEQLSGPLSWLDGLPPDVLLCVDEAPQFDRTRLKHRPVVAAGLRPGEGWRFIDLEPLPEDEGVRLFLEHAPLAHPRSLVETLVHRLEGNPTAIVAAARRWPSERIEAILVNPLPLPRLRAVYDVLTEAERDVLALVSHLPVPARHEGLSWCGMSESVQQLVAIGWVTVDAPGQYRLGAALAEAIRPWRSARVQPYLAWFLQESRARVMDWDTSEGAREWFRSGLWPLLSKQRRGDRPEAWFFLAWALSGESPSMLLDALERERAGLAPIVVGRCAAHAYQALGEHKNAARVLRAALETPRQTEPHHEALARMELGVAYHWLRETSVARETYLSAILQLSAARLHRGRLLCTARLAMLEHSTKDHAAARRRYLDAIAEADTMGYAPLRGYFSSNLGVLLLESDELEEARRLCQEAIRDVAAGSDDRLLAMTYINQASVELLDGELTAADRLHREALKLLGDADPGMTALCHARRGAVAALRGDPESARGHHQRAAAIPVEDPVKVAEIALWQVFLEWVTDDRPSVMARRRRCFSGEVPLADRSDETRLVLRLLERRAVQAGDTLLVGSGGSWFRLPGQEPVELRRYQAATRILMALAEAAELRPDACCTGPALIQAGWPDEQIVETAARNRLSVALARLRRLGLRDIIERVRDGWRLDPEWRIMLQRSNDIGPPRALREPELAPPMRYVRPPRETTAPLRLGV